MIKNNIFSLTIFALALNCSSARAHPDFENDSEPPKPFIQVLLDKQPLIRNGDIVAIKNGADYDVYDYQAGEFLQTSTKSDWQNIRKKTDEPSAWNIFHLFSCCQKRQKNKLP